MNNYPSLAFSLLPFALCLSLPIPAIAQISSDGSVPTTVTPGNNFTINGGLRTGSNLFHSFSEFSVPNGGSAYFNNAFDVQNIINRVTGTSISNIDGLLRANGTANLFLINPNGIIFGENSSLNIGGSFVATTANALRLANGDVFSSDRAQPLPSQILNVAPSALLFNQIAAGNIINRSITPDANPINPGSLNGLRVNDGNSILLLGGNVTVDGGVLTSLSGIVELTGLAGAGELGLKFFGSVPFVDFAQADAQGVQNADVLITNGSRINASAAIGNKFDAGGIFIRGKTVSIENKAQLATSIYEPENAGLVLIAATENVSITGESQILSTVESQGVGKAGGIIIKAPSISVKDGAQLQTLVRGGGIGNAGVISLQATNNVSLTGDGSGIFSTVESTGIGNAGGIVINSPSISLQDGAQLQTLVRENGLGNAGLIFLQATDSVSLEGNGTAILSTIQPGAVGNLDTLAGNIFGDSLATGGDLIASIGIETGTLTIKNGAQINTSTGGIGNAGAVIVLAKDSVSIENGIGILSGVAKEATGSGGGIIMVSKSFSATNGGGLTTETQGQGNAGVILLVVEDSISLKGNNAPPTSLQTGIASTASLGSSGKGGGIIINSRSLSITDGAGVSVSSAATGSAGDIIMTMSQDITMDGGSITAESLQTGGGNIVISAKDISLRNSSLISTSVFNGNGGGGDVFLVGTNPESSKFMALEDSDLLAAAENGPGGNITGRDIPAFIYDKYAPVRKDFVDARIFRNNGRVDISASSRFGTNGVVDVPDFTFLQNSISPLAANFVSPDQVVAGSCLARRNVERGSFTVTGTGGLQPTPYDAQSDRYRLVDVQPLEEEGERGRQGEGETENNQSPIQDSIPPTPLQKGGDEIQNWKLGDRVVEAQAMTATADGRILVATATQKVEPVSAKDLICHPDTEPEKPE